jgi:hypothetical protein
LAWIFNENRVGNLTFSWFANGRIEDNQQVYGMTSGYVDGKLNIEVNLSLLAIWFWDSYKDHTPIPPMRRNDLAIMLSHEVIHLQHGKDVLEAVKTNLALRKEEERRTWTVTVLEDVRPLIASGEKLNEHFVQASDAFKACSGDPLCPAFESFIDGHMKK